MAFAQAAAAGILNGMDARCDDIARHDGLTRRCPKLGHEVAFAYCRHPAGPLPCRKIFDCWWQQFDVQAFVLAHYGEQAVREIVAEPKPKITTLVELIERARRRGQRQA